MILNDLSAADAAEYKAFFTEALHRHPDCFRISAADEAREPFPTLGAPDSFTLAFRTETGALAGLVSFQREGATRERLRHRGMLFRMYVAREFGGQGLGKRLIEEVLRRAAALGDIEQINLTVVSTNLPARRLYESFGFNVWGIEPRAIKHPDGQYFDEAQMTKFLTSPFPSV